MARPLSHDGPPCDALTTGRPIAHSARLRARAVLKARNVQGFLSPEATRRSLPGPIAQRPLTGLDEREIVAPLEVHEYHEGVLRRRAPASNRSIKRRRKHDAT